MVTVPDDTPERVVTPQDAIDQRNLDQHGTTTFACTPAAPTGPQHTTEFNPFPPFRGADR
jgi:hypothetical protein